MFSSAAILVHIAAMFYVAGFLVRDQLVLRMLVLTGTLLYLIYYYVALDDPLWDAIFWSVVMGMANLFVIIQLIFERTTFNMSEYDKRLFAVFEGMTPGEFRRILKITKWRNSDGETKLTVENEPVHSLYYVLDGPTQIHKQGQSFSIGNSAFIGEVGFFLKTNASATVRVAEGGHYVEWNGDELRALQAKYPGIRAALHSILNADMASKVAKSMGTEALA